MPVSVRTSIDVDELTAALDTVAATDPAKHNIMASLLHEGLPPEARSWCAYDGDLVGAVAICTARTRDVLLSSLSPWSIEPLALALAAGAGPSIVGLEGAAEDAAPLAGTFGAASGRAGRPAEALRLLEVGEVRLPAAPAGHRRRSTVDDLDLIANWMAEFDAETALDAREPAAPDATRARTFLERRAVEIWEQAGTPVACAMVTTAALGVSRVGFVYTAPDARGRGVAARLVAEVSAEVLAARTRCILFTQLTNPLSNRVYSRLGYRAVGERLRYTFDPPAVAPTP